MAHHVCPQVGRQGSHLLRVTATGLLRFGHSWAAVHALHTVRPSAAHPTGRFLLTLIPKAYAGTGVQAVYPGP
ncbi:hypothetical protein [Streptomyces sp. NPDC017991]|uniref:hypothetical protein n=1 Tax=Streptomyces sp. NPDC017991 TaxID=3365026 RepID=UPI0037A4733C